MFIRKMAFLQCFLILLVRSFALAASFEPISYFLGEQPQLEGLHTFSSDTILNLTTSQPVLTLDYGTEVAGFPSFDVKSLDVTAQVELKYTEQWDGLNQIYGDGPFPFAVTLANTYRTETFMVDQAGKLESFFIQGGLRWQSIRLISGMAITIQNVSIRATVATTPVEQMPGQFSSSNSLFTDIWGLGARTVQSLCLEKGSQPSTWEITEEGALIRGQQTAQSAIGVAFGNYTLSFATKIIRGGVGWRVASRSNPYGPLLVVTSEYPANTTFVNTNTTLLPPNTLIIGHGYSLVNQSTLTSAPLSYFPLPFNLTEDEWHQISTAITPDGYRVEVDGIHVTTFPFDIAKAYQSLYSYELEVTDGTWGFGPYQDQVAIVADVQVTSQNGTLLYSNDMKREDILAEYGVQANQYSFCSDGAKRDRLLWIGVDFLHAIKAIGASTNRLDFATGTIAAAFDWQATSGDNEGLVAINAQMGASPQYKSQFYDALYGILDWELFFLLHITSYYQLSGDLATIQAYWTQLKTLVNTLLEDVDPYSGLVSGAKHGGFFFFEGVNGTVPSTITVMALDDLAVVANQVGDASTALMWQRSADAIRSAITNLLWNDELGAFAISLSNPGNYSVLSISLPIIAGVADKNQSQRMISALQALKLGPAYKESSGVEDGPTVQLSSNMNGFLLQALFIANNTNGIECLDVAGSLLDEFWSLMITQDEYYTGTTWEYMYPDGKPGIDFYTASSHEWGVAPTYVLTSHVLGITAVEPGFQAWAFNPSLFGLNLTSCHGEVPTPHGIISASWEFNSEATAVHLSCVGPIGTTGTLNLSTTPAWCESDGRRVDCANLTADNGAILNVTVYF